MTANRTTIQPVPLDKAYRLINHGPTVLVSAQHQEDKNVMAASWSCPLDFSPPKVTLVLDKNTYTRRLVEDSGYFALQLPTQELAQFTLNVGTISALKEPNKIAQANVKWFYMPDFDKVPLVEDCAAWLICRVIPEPHMQTSYDLFIGEVVAAWADNQLFEDGRWLFDEEGHGLRTLHYISGGQFYTTGRPVKLNKE